MKQQTTVEEQTLGTLMVLGEQPVLLLVVEELGLVRKARLQGSQVQIPPPQTEGKEFHPGHRLESAPERTKHLREEV